MTRTLKDRVLEAATAYLSGVGTAQREDDEYMRVLGTSPSPAHFSEYFESLHASNISQMWMLLAETDEKPEPDHTDLIAKLDTIIFDPACPRELRAVASDVTERIGKGDDPFGRLRYSASRSDSPVVIAGAILIREMLKAAGL